MKATVLAVLLLSAHALAEQCLCYDAAGACLDNKQDSEFLCKAPKIAMIGTIVILGVTFLAYILDLALFVPAKIEVSD